MPGDLEEFLKRAAARRQAKEQQQQAAAPRPTQRPQYSDRRRERVVRPPEVVEPILVAEVVEVPDSMAQRRHAIEEAKRKAKEAEAEAAKKLAKLKKSAGKSTTSDVTLTGDARADILRLLKQPGGIKQAILLREILERPKW